MLGLNMALPILKSAPDGFMAYSQSMLPASLGHNRSVVMGWPIRSYGECIRESNSKVQVPSTSQLKQQPVPGLERPDKVTFAIGASHACLAGISFQR